MLVDVLVFAMAAAAVVAFLVFAPFLYDYVRLRIGSFKIDPGPIAGFARSYSVERGKPVDLYIHSTAPFVLKTLRLETDWVEVGSAIELPAQHQSRRFNWRQGVAWRKSISLETSALSPGLYRFDIVQKSGDSPRFSIPMIVKGKEPRPLCLILGTNTWEAYNAFGGLSHYENKRIFKLSKLIGEFLQRPKWAPNFVSKLRPNTLFATEVAMPPFGETYSSFTIRNELEFLVFLNRAGITFSLYSDDDLGRMTELSRAEALVFPGHCEYWSDEMHYALERHMARGGKVYFSNSSLEGHCTPKSNGWEFRTRPPEQLSNPISGTHGTQEGVFTAAPYKVLEAGHWIFAGTGMRTGDLFGEKCLNYPSVDAVGHAHLRRTIDLKGQPRQGASGYFTGKTGSGSGAFTTLAVGTNPLGPAHMVYRDLPGGGWVFNPSSYSFNGALLHDPVIAKIVANLMRDAAGKAQAMPEVTKPVSIHS